MPLKVGQVNVVVHFCLGRVLTHWSPGATGLLPVAPWTFKVWTNYDLETVAYFTLCACIVLRPYIVTIKLHSLILSSMCCALQSVYMHSSISDRAILVVFELVAKCLSSSAVDGSKLCDIGCGWGFIPLFKPSVKSVDVSDTSAAPTTRYGIQSTDHMVNLSPANLRRVTLTTDVIHRVSKKTGHAYYVS